MKDDSWSWLFALGVGVAIGGLAVLMFLRASPSSAPPTIKDSLRRVPAVQAVQTNEEIWEWTDWRGRDRKITVHRKVKKNV